MRASLVLGGLLAAVSCTLAHAGPVPPVHGSLRGRAMYVQEVQAAAGKAYSFHAAAGALQAENPAQGAPVRASPDGIRLGDAQVRLLRYGCAERLHTATAVTPQARGNRVDYRRPGIKEWYVNGPLGLEQGFTVEQEQHCAGWLHFEVALGDGARSGALHASELYASDATGRTLPTRMRRSGPALHIEVDGAGARYPVVIDPIYGILQARLVTGSTVIGEFMGSAVALSSDGSTALLGAYGMRDKGDRAGGGYVYVRSGSTWSSQARLIAGDGQRDDNLGSAVALSADGNTALIGAPQYSSGGNGIVYVYVRSGSTWTQQARLTGGGAYPSADFGTAVSLASDGNTALIGAKRDFGKATLSGAAYVFVRSGTTWSQQNKLVASDGAYKDALGSSTALVGDGNTALVGAPTTASGGAAYVFVRSGTTWTEQKKLVPSDGTAGSGFGIVALSLDGSTALVGAPAPGASMTKSAAYVFVRSGTTWTEQKKIAPADIKVSEEFGAAVALSADGSVALVGGPRVDVKNLDDGAAYLFSRAGTVWSEQRRFSRGGINYSLFGYSTALAADGGTALVGEPYANDSAIECGGANVYVPGKVNATACTLAAECNSGFCADGVCCDASCGSDDGDCQACSAAKGAVADGICTAVRAGQSCRAATGPCEDEALCQSGNKLCPTTKYKSSLLKCRDAADVCMTNAYCSGSSADCPPSSYRPSTYVCRAPAGPCDSAERCSGAAASCPANQLQAAGFQCRAAGNECGAPAICDGSTVSCELASSHPDGSACSQGTCQLGGCRTEAELALTALQADTLERPMGEPFALALTLLNKGKSVAEAPEVQWTLPAGIQVLASSGQGWLCSEMTPVRCSRSDLAPGVIIPLTLTLLLPSTAGSYAVAATVQSATYDPVPGNNSAQVDLVVKAPAPTPEPTPEPTPPASAASGCQYSAAKTAAPSALSMFLLSAGFLLRRRSTRRRQLYGVGPSPDHRDGQVNRRRTYIGGPLMSSCR